MITDRTQFRIICSTATELTIEGPASAKTTYKQHTEAQPWAFERLRKMAQLAHPHLLSLQRVQLLQSNSQSQNKTSLGLYYEHFSCSLEKCAKGGHYDEQQIVNTFQPILEVLEFLEHHSYPISTINLRNIVMTESQDVKYIDELIIDPRVDKAVTMSKLYQDLSLILFSLLLKGKTKPFKSWKNNLQLLREKFTKQTYNFFMTIFNRSLLSSREAPKTKKIAKRHKPLEGKQNKLLQ